MEIEFNSSRVPKVEPSQTAVRPSAAAPTDEASFAVSAALQEKLKNISDVRPEKVAYAKSLVADAQYPPDDVMDRIAVLLATNVNP